MSIIFSTFARFFMNFKEYIPYYKRNFKVALPVMLTQLGATLVGLFDSIMVGHYATVDLAAVSLSNAIFFTIMVFAMGVLMGVTPMVGIEHGKAAANSDRKISAYLQNGIWVTLLLSGAMVLILGSCMLVFDHIGQDPEVIRVARPYYILIVASIVPFLFFFLFKQFLEGVGNTLAAMLITLFVNGLNILLNWVFIFGHWGAPAMGATGAGLATLIARGVQPFLFLLVIALRRSWRKYLQLFERHKNSWKTIGQMLRIGTPIGVQTLLETFTFTISFVIIGYLSKEALAAQQVANQIADITFMLATGIGAATTIRVSHQLGKHDLHAVRMASNASIHLVLLCNTIGAALMIGLRNEIPLWFTNDMEVCKIASKLILFAGLFQYADGLQCVGAAMLRGIEDVKRPMVYAFVAYILIALPIGLICTFPLHMGASGMWVGFIFGLSIAAILFHTRFRRTLRHLR